MNEQLTRHIEIREFPTQRVVRIRERMRMDELAMRIRGDLAELHAFLVSQGIAPAGAPYLQCPEPDATKVVDAEIGWPVDREVTAQGRIEAGTLPACRAAWTEHRGSYATIDKTYAALYEWIGRNGHVPAGPAREVYVTGPEVTDPARIVTEVIAPIR